MVTAALGAAPTLHVMTGIRRLFYEAFTLAAAELRSRLDRSEDSGPRKLPAPERAHRQEEQVRLLRGPSIEGESEPSDAMDGLNPFMPHFLKPCT